MGCMSSRKQMETQLKQSSPDIDIIFNDDRRYKYHELFQKIDEIIIQTEISLPEYITLLTYCYYPYNNNLINEYNYRLFVIKKLLSNPLVNSKYLIDNDLFSKYLNFNCEIFCALLKAYHQFNKKILSICSIEKHSVPINLLYCLGIVYCYGEYNDKINILFNILSNHNSLIIKNNKVRIVIYCLLAVSTSIVLFAVKKCQIELFDLGFNIEDDDFLNMYNKFELKDCYKSSDYIYNMLFSKDSTLDYNMFQSLFENNDDIKCLLEINGLRYLVENHNA